MSKLDLNKPVMTKDGKAARIICTDRRINDCGPVPVVALVMGDFGESLYAYREDGCWVGGGPDNHNSLINVPESKWMNLYADPDSSRVAAIWRESRASADGVADLRFQESGARRVAVVEWTGTGDFIVTKFDDWQD